MDGKSLLSLPYSARRVVVVDKGRQSEPGRSAPTMSWRSALESIAGVTPADGGWTRAWKAYRSSFGLTAYVTLYKAAKLRREPPSGDEFLVLTEAEVTGLSLPPGHPRDRVVYIGHPFDPPVYIPAAAFHRFLFEHKVAEAIRLLTALAATSIAVEYAEGWGREANMTISAPLPTGAPIDLGGSVGAFKSGGDRSVSHLELNPSREAYLPDGLVWFSHEPLWQEMARARLSSGLRQFQVDVSYADDYGVTARFAANVTGAGLELGGSFVDYRSTVWRLRGSFADRK